MQLSNNFSIKTCDIYSALGYKEHRQLKKLITKNIAEFKYLGSVQAYANKSIKGSGGGRPITWYSLNINQLILLMSLAKNTSEDIKKQFSLSIISAIINNDLSLINDLIRTIDVYDLPVDRFVYVAREDHSGRYKIGISKDPERRIKELNIGNPENLTLVHHFKAIESGYQSEALAHALYAEHRIRSEWFKRDIDLNLLPNFSDVVGKTEILSVNMLELAGNRLSN